MKHKRYPIFIVILTVMLLNSLACTLPQLLSQPEEDTQENELDTLEVTSVEPLELQTGEPVSLFSGFVDSQGGLIQISGTNSPIEGFSISIPPDAYHETVNFSVSYLPILHHNLPSDLTIITPLIRIENEGIYAQDHIELTLPCLLSTDQFAMLFAINEDNGNLEPLSLVDQDETHIAALTRHFTDFLGIAVNKAALEALNIKTEFVHGVHTWQFANEGSYLAPDGYCAGMNLLALDNYLRRNKATLNGVYDNFNNNHTITPDQPFDDRLAMRLVSVAQKKINFQGENTKFWNKVQKTQDHTLTYYAMALSLKAPSEPQYISVYSSTGEGHSLILYGNWKDRFYVSDPNYPEKTANRFLFFDRSTGKFRTYQSGPNARNLGKAYPHIFYRNKYDYLNNSQLVILWSELTAGTIGDGLFPPTSLYLQTYQPATLGLKKRASIYEINNATSFIFVDKKDMSGLSRKMKLINILPDSAVTVVNEKGKKVAQGRDQISIPLTNPSGTPYLFAFWDQLLVRNQPVWIDGRWITFYQSLTGIYNGGVCAESESEPHRWELNIIQDTTGYVSGVSYFHNCPGGGAVNYVVQGTQKPGEPTVSLTGIKTGGRGNLGESSAYQVTFTFGLKQPLTPNFAP